VASATGAFIDAERAGMVPDSPNCQIGQYGETIWRRERIDATEEDPACPI
jgi:hypothetical protein